MYEVGSRGAPENRLRALLTLLANVRLGWKSLPRTNALAYYGNSYLAAVKSFISLATVLSKLKCLRFSALDSEQTQASALGANYFCK